MENKAKLKGQGRHTLNTLAGTVVGIGLSRLATDEDVAALVSVFENVGVRAEIQVFLGFAVLLAAHLWSWFDKAKQKGEGDAK